MLKYELEEQVSSLKIRIRELKCERDTAKKKLEIKEIELSSEKSINDSVMSAVTAFLCIYDVPSRNNYFESCQRPMNEERLESPQITDEQKRLWHIEHLLERKAGIGIASSFY